MGAPHITDEQCYVGRHFDARPVNLTLTREALGLLRTFVPAGSHRKFGEFVSRLLFEHAARLSERQRMLDQLTVSRGESIP